MTILTIRFDLRNPAASGVATADRFAACLEMCEWAERSGFVAVVLSEHHGVEDGYLPSIFTMAAAIAARTERMLINLAAVIAPCTTRSVWQRTPPWWISSAAAGCTWCWPTATSPPSSRPSGWR
jgi:hypothetical protein